MVILHTQIQRVFNLVPGQKQFSFFSSFFSSLYDYYSYSMRYCISGPNSRSVLASSTTMGNGERTGERERKTISYIIVHIIKKGTTSFNAQCTHISAYTLLMVSRVHIRHPFCKKEKYTLIDILLLREC
jgi:hypothetical protein